MLTLENSPGLAEIIVNEHWGMDVAERFVRWAQDALEQGHDSPALLKLAIEEPPFFTPDLRRLFEAATREIGMETVSFEQARVFHAQRVARELVAAAATPRHIAETIARIFPLRDTPHRFKMWWQLEEAFDCDYCLRTIQSGGTEWDQTVRDEVDRLLRFNWREA